MIVFNEDLWEKKQEHRLADADTHLISVLNNFKEQIKKIVSLWDSSD